MSAIKALQREWLAAQQDPQAKLPTRLELAIVGVLAESAIDESDRYADTMIRRDKETPRWERDGRTGARDTGAQR